MIRPNRRLRRSTVVLEDRVRVLVLGLRLERVRGPGVGDPRAAIDPGRRPDRRAESIGPGSYDFFCTVHPWMEGTLTVTGAGGGGDADATPPQVEVRILDGRIRAVRRRGALRVRVTVDSPARVRVRALVGRGDNRRMIARGRRAIDSERSKRIAARLTKPGRRALAGRGRARVTVIARAVDEDGNASTARARRALR